MATLAEGLSALSIRSAEISAALANKNKSVDELAKKNQDFAGEIEQFRAHVKAQQEQLSKLRNWLAWERAGLKELQALKARRCCACRCWRFFLLTCVAAG